MFVGVMVDNFGRMSVLLDSVSHVSIIETADDSSSAKVAPEANSESDVDELDDLDDGDDEARRAGIAYLVTERTQAQQDAWSQQADAMHQAALKEFERREQQASRSCCYRTVTSAEFELLVAIIILLNVVAMMSEHHNQSDQWESYLDLANLAFTAAFFVEMTVKLIALGISEYFKSGWNI